MPELPNGSARIDYSLWPTLNSTWSCWQDLVLAAQLTAVRLNAGTVAFEWRQDEEKLLQVYCRYKSDTAGSGRNRILLARPSQPDGSSLLTVVAANQSTMRFLDEHTRGPEDRRDTGVNLPKGSTLRAATVSPDQSAFTWSKVDCAQTRVGTVAFSV
ncbi:hypothetical protein JCM10296v2_004387 [Rhodotorula toruloides]